MNDEQALRRRISAVKFACWELHLFLDTHPNNCEAARKMEDYRRQLANLTQEFEEKFGPIGETSQDTSRWAWISDPWPSEKEAN